MIYARGISYEPDGIAPAAQWDHQQPYLEHWLRFVGVPSVTSFAIEKTLLEEQSAQIFSQPTAAGRAV